LELIEVTVTIYGQGGTRSRRLLVDTGSTYTWIDGELLKEIGATPVATEQFRTIDKRMIERQVTDVILEYAGSRRYCPVAFAEKSDANVLGATAMEIMGLEVDPSSREVKRIAAHTAYSGS
jgi:predicted aspartyl protease